MEVDPTKQVVVVGAGLSGLTAAYYLQQAGYQVHVLELLERPGGRVLTQEKDGYLIDAGPDAVTEGYRDWLELVRALGLADQLEKSSGVIGFVRNGKVYDLDASKPISAAFSPALPWRAKLQMALAAPKLPSRLAGLDSFELVQSSDLDDPACDAAAYARTFFGEEAARHIIDPIVRLTTGSGASSASQLSALAPLTAWTQPLVNIRGGLGVVPAALARAVPVSYGIEVTSVRESNEGVDVEYRAADGSVSTIRAAQCVISTMYHTACSIFPKLAAVSTDFGSRLKDVKLISISLGYASSCKSRAYAIMVPTEENADLMLAFLQHNKASDRAPSGHSLITFYTDTQAYERFDALTDQQIKEWASATAERLFPELRGSLRSASVTRWPKAGYLADPGFWRRTSSLLAGLSEVQRVHLAGDLFGAGSMESAVRWGKRTAERISAGASPVLQ